MSQSQKWSYLNGIISHRSNHFFSIVGIRWKSPSGKIILQPLIDQNEVGLLGFLIRKKKAKVELLVQAKIEPGNVGGIQLAPTYQATASNSFRIHGGDYPPYSKLFIQTRLQTIHNSLQSEHGDRFLGKRNRNVLVKTQKTIPKRSTHRWMSTDELLNYLKLDYLVNTDARSVLVCSPWDSIINRTPFSRYKSIFNRELAESFYKKPDQKRFNRLELDFNKVRAKIGEPTIVGLDKVRGWRVRTKGVLAAVDRSFDVRFIEVIAQGREVPVWDQPILDTKRKGYIDLLCGRDQKGILHFLFHTEIEPGLYNFIELGPTVIKYSANRKTSPLNYHGKIIMQCDQSEEGGRFYRDRVRYRIIDVGKMFNTSNGYYWLTLSEIQILAKEEGWFTNEARSALSLILSFL